MRLSHRSIRPAGRPVEIRFDGRTVPALEGETIAAALSAAGTLAFRETPTGAPRGLHCGMGACFDCVVTVDGRIGASQDIDPDAELGLVLARRVRGWSRCA